MNLTVRYSQLLKKIKDNSFGDLSLTQEQIELLNILRKEITNNSGKLLNPLRLGFARRSGKTTLMLKLAEEFTVPLVVNNVEHARRLKHSFPHINIVSSSETIRLRGARVEGVVIDEGVKPQSVDPNVKILTGFQGGYFQ